MTIALLPGAKPSAVFAFGTQCGVKHAVGWFNLSPIDNAIDKEHPWSQTSLARTKSAYDKMGYQLSLIESRPPMETLKLAQSGRDDEIDVICTFIRNMGAVGIPVWCQAWMPIHLVIRTSVDISTRGGAKASDFDHEEFKRTATPHQHGEIIEEDQWNNLKYFL